MIKTVLTSSYDSPSANIIGVTSKGLDASHLRKSASGSINLFKDVKIKPEKDKAVLHIVAMSAAPYYPANKNADSFYDTNRTIEVKATGKQIKLGLGLIDTHKTFETDAKVYKEHFNTKNDHVYGDVLKSGYNDELNRVELLISIPTDEWQDELRSLERGDNVGFSMSASLKADLCSYCGHRATKRSEYCDCLKHQMGQITSDGHLISAINDDVKFFDISGVRTPADRVAFGLLKVASENKIMGGAELAETLRIPNRELPYLSKFSTVLKKLAEMEKQIDAAATPEDNCNAAALIPDIPEDHMNTLRTSRLNSEELLGTLADAKIVLSMRDFLRIITGHQFDEISPFISKAEDKLPGVFSRICVNPKVQDGVINLPTTRSPHSIFSVLEDLESSNGLSEGPIRKRVTISVIRKTPVYTKKAAVISSDDSMEETLAQLYGQYKAAFCHKHLDDNVLTFYSVLSHYVSTNKK